MKKFAVLTACLCICLLSEATKIEGAHPSTSLLVSPLSSFSHTTIFPGLSM